MVATTLEVDTVAGGNRMVGSMGGSTSFEFLREFASSNGVGNRRSDGSSSENECNGKFDLNHVE